MTRKNVLTISISLLIAILLFCTAILWTQQSRLQSGLTLQPLKVNTNRKQLPLNVVGIGDSLTRGVGDIKQHGYAGLTTTKLKKLPSVSRLQFNDYGVTGNTTGDLIQVLKEKKVQKSIKNADYIFMTIGGNDLVNILKSHFLNLKMADFVGPKKTFSDHLDVIFSTIRKLNPNATIYYSGLYNPFENYVAGLDQKFSVIINKWNQVIQTKVKKDGNAYFVPTFDIFHNHTDSLLYVDHFHPNKKGYTLLSNRLFSEIQSTSIKSAEKYNQ